MKEHTTYVVHVTRISQRFKRINKIIKITLDLHYKIEKQWNNVSKSQKHGQSSLKLSLSLRIQINKNGQRSQQIFHIN